MTQITPTDALALAKLFKEAALAVGQYQLDHWDALAENQRRELTDTEYAILDHSQNLITAAVGVQLAATQTSLAEIQQAAVLATQAIQKLQELKQVLAVAAGLIALGAAVATGNPGSIATVVSTVLALAKT